MRPISRFCFVIRLNMIAYKKPMNTPIAAYAIVINITSVTPMVMLKIKPLEY